MTWNSRVSTLITQCQVTYLISNLESFQYFMKIISKLKDAHKTILVSSTKEWTKLQQKIAAVLDVFPTSLRVQCVLPGDKSTDPKISLTSQEDLNDLHLELRAKIVPPWNVNRKHSKRKHKE